MHIAGQFQVDLHVSPCQWFNQNSSHATTTIQLQVPESWHPLCWQKRSAQHTLQQKAEPLYERSIRWTSIRYEFPTATGKELFHDTRTFSSLLETLKSKLRQELERSAKHMNLNSVRICFEAFALHNDVLHPICAPIYSRPIANQSELQYLFPNDYSHV